MENLRRISNNELSELWALVTDINERIETYCHVSLPLSVTNALATFEQKLEKEFERREL
jgi:hypothetical protein